MTHGCAWIADGPEDAEPVILLHSLGSDASMWRPQAQALAGTYRVVRIDTRGHGASPAPPGPYTLEQLVQDVLDVADAKGLARFHLCGVSLGGSTALWLAIRHGDRLRSLTVANTAAKVATAEFWQARIDAVRTRGLVGIRDDVVARLFADGFATTHPDWLAEAREVFVSADPDGYMACCAALADADLRDDVGRIVVPTLVVGGDSDVATPPADAAWLHDRIDGSRLEIIPGAAHLSNLDRPAEFTAALRGHLERHVHRHGSSAEPLSRGSSGSRRSW